MIGKPLKISVVSEAAAGGTLIFDGEITALEAEIDRDRSVAVVRGLDPAHRLQRGTNTETHLDVTYGDIVAKVAQRRGLQQGDGGSNTVVHEAVVQWNQTDWEFLSTLAAEIGHEIVVAERKLHLREPGESSAGPAAGDLRASNDPRKLVAGANLLRLRATVSGAEQVAEVEVRGWDYKAKEAVDGHGQGRRHVTQRVGRDRLGDARRRARRRHAGQVRPAGREQRDGAGRRRLADRAARQRGGRAGGHRRRAIRRCGPGSRSASPAPARTFDGKYVLTSCRHTYDAGNGYQTAFRVSGRQTRTMLGLVRGGGDRRSVGVAGSSTRSSATSTTPTGSAG